MSDFRLIHGPEMTILDHSIKEALIQAKAIENMASSGSTVYSSIRSVEMALDRIKETLDVLRKIA